MVGLSSQHFQRKGPHSPLSQALKAPAPPSTGKRKFGDRCTVIHYESKEGQLVALNTGERDDQRMHNQRADKDGCLNFKDTPDKAGCHPCVR